MTRSIGWLCLAGLFVAVAAMATWQWSTKPDCREGETPVFNRYIGEYGWFCGRRP